MKICSSLALLLVSLLTIDSRVYAQDASGEDIYKHYTGTIGDKHITLDLRYGYQGASNYGGSTYYGDKGDKTLFIIVQPKSFDHDVMLHCEEYPDDTVLSNDEYFSRRKNMPTWDFKIAGNKLTGKWHSGNGKETKDIVLEENYSQSVPFDISFYVANATIKGEKMQNDITGVVTNKNTDVQDAAFINEQEKKFIDSVTPSFDCSMSRHLLAFFMPVYNDKRILVLACESRCLYPGPTYKPYLCLDLQQKKQLAFDDILKSDTARLSFLLANAIRKKYYINSDQRLSTKFLYDRVPVTANIYPAGNGIYFWYASGAMAAKKDITVFIPYEELTGVLTDTFKKRMGL